MRALRQLVLKKISKIAVPPDVRF